MTVHPGDIQRALDAVQRGGRLTEMVLDGDDPVGTFDGEDRDILVQGGLRDPIRVKGQGSLVVEGDITGDEEHPIQIEVQGDVIVTGSVHHASIRSRNCLIAADAHRVQITTSTRCFVGSTIQGGRFVSGDYEGTKRTIESLRMSLRHARDEVESLSRKVLTEEKRLDKACRALRIPLDFNVGRVVLHADGRVRIGLDAFYSSVEGRSRQDVERALGEFFTRGIIGVITRQNRKYLVNYPAREKVFLQLITGLRSLFNDVLRRDDLERSVDEMEQSLKGQVRALEGRRSSIEAGNVAGATDFEFIVPRIAPLSGDDGFDFAHRSACLEIRPNGVGAEMVSRSADGSQAAVTVTSAELESLLFQVEGDRVVWHSSEAALA